MKMLKLANEDAHREASGSILPSESEPVAQLPRFVWPLAFETWLEAKVKKEKEEKEKEESEKGEPSKDSICMHSDYWTTTATLQFLPRSRRLRVAFDSACTARFSDFEVGSSFARS